MDTNELLELLVTLEDTRYKDQFYERGKAMERGDAVMEKIYQFGMMESFARGEFLQAIIAERYPAAKEGA